MKQIKICSFNGGIMKNQIKQTLLSMMVRQNREDAETKALGIYKSGKEAFDIVVDLGWEALKGNLQDNRELLRAISFTISLFLTKAKPPTRPDTHPGAVDLLIKFADLGFNSARNCLNHLGFTPKEIWQRQLMALPLVERHLNDKEVSLKEAVSEIELSRALEGTKGISKDHYCLGKDTKHRYDIYHIEKKRFVLRSAKLR